MTVAHINIGLGGGGAEHIILELAKKGNQNGVKNIAISITDINAIEHKFQREGIETHYLNFKSFRFIKQTLKKMDDILGSEKNLVLHCHMFHGLMFGIFYNLLFKKVPIIFTLHNVLVEEIYRRHLLFFTKPIRKADINFSKNSKKWYLNPIHIIPNGIDFSKFKAEQDRLYLPNEKFIFLFLGRVEEQKNPLVIVELIAKLLKSGKRNFEIHVAGDGSLLNQLEKKIIQNNYVEYIKLLGFQKEVHTTIESSHCLILPSLWEGLPLTLIEASASKLPIITTPVGSIPEYFNATNSYVSDLQNFHLSMIEVMDDYENALIKANKSFEDNKNLFDIEVVYQKHQELYNQFAENMIMT